MSFMSLFFCFFFFSSRRRHTRSLHDWSSDVCSSDLITASFIGNFVEWFDYAVYGYLAGIISTVFFPESDRQTALLATFGVFAISFFVRPLGGFIWGHIGDKLGRKQALSLSIVLMSVATFCIALIPGYATIGVMAPILLLLVRV